MTVIKYGLAGLSFAYLLIQTKTQNGYRVPAFATAYALSGWMVANQLNLMWLDAVIILPLVILGIERLAEKNRLTTYIPWLTSILVINYYMAYMVCLFLIGYFLWTACRHFTTWSNFWRFTRNFTIGSITSAFYQPSSYFLRTFHCLVVRPSIPSPSSNSNLSTFHQKRLLNSF